MAIGACLKICREPVLCGFPLVSLQHPQKHIGISQQNDRARFFLAHLFLGDPYNMAWVLSPFGFPSKPTQKRAPSKKATPNKGSSWWFSIGVPLKIPPKNMGHLPKRQTHSAFQTHPKPTASSKTTDPFGAQKTLTDPRHPPKPTGDQFGESASSRARSSPASRCRSSADCLA